MRKHFHEKQDLNFFYETIYDKRFQNFLNFVFMSQLFWPNFNNSIIWYFYDHCAIMYHCEKNNVYYYYRKRNQYFRHALIRRCHNTFLIILLQFHFKNGPIFLFPNETRSKQTSKSFEIQSSISPAKFILVRILKYSCRNIFSIT